MFKLIVDIIACIAGVVLFVFAIPGMMAWRLYYAKGNQAQAEVLSDGRTEFAPRPWALLIWMAFAIYCAYAAISSFRPMHGSVWNWAGICILGMSALEHLVSFPGTVAVTREGLEQIYWLRRDKRIPW